MVIAMKGNMEFPSSTYYEQKEPLRVGDVVSYNDPLYVMGWIDGHCVTQVIRVSAEIKSTNRKGKYPMTIEFDNGVSVTTCHSYNHCSKCPTKNSFEYHTIYLGCPIDIFKAREAAKKAEKTSTSDDSDDDDDVDVDDDDYGCDCLIIRRIMDYRKKQQELYRHDGLRCSIHSYRCAVGRLTMTRQRAKAMEEQYNKIYNLQIQQMKRRRQKENEEEKRQQQQQNNDNDNNLHHHRRHHRRPLQTQQLQYDYKRLCSKF
jgi:hypothetical protein